MDKQNGYWQNKKTKIQSCFSNETEVHVAKEPDELDSLIETLKLRTHDIVDENDVDFLFGKNKKMGRSYCYGRRFGCCWYF